MENLAQRMRAALRHHAARTHVGDETCEACAVDVIDAATEAGCVALDTAKDVSDGALRTVELLDGELRTAQRQRDAALGAKDDAYAERNRCVAALARMALALGYRAGIGEDPRADASWRTVLFIDFPTGQVSWHFGDQQRHLLVGLPPYTGAWDGHDNEMKYERLHRGAVPPSSSSPSPLGPDEMDTPQSRAIRAETDSARAKMVRDLMTPVPGLLLALGLTVGSAAHAGADRAVIENGTTTGTVTPATHPTLIWGQTSATLVAITCAADSCTRAAPSGAVEGMRLDNAGAYRVEACLTAGTFAGGGSIKLYPYNQNTSSWSYLLGADLGLSDATGLSGCVSWLTSVNSFRATEWRLVARPVGVTTAGGGQLSIRMSACLKGGCAP